MNQTSPSIQPWRGLVIVGSYPISDGAWQVQFTSSHGAYLADIKGHAVCVQ